MKTITTLLFLISSGFLFCQEDWNRFEIGKIDSIYLYLRVKEYACAADVNWIGFEFENRSNDTIVSERSCSFSIERNAYGWIGNLVRQANYYPFIESDGFSSLIPPGVRKKHKGLSTEGSCMLGIPDKDSDTTEVFCTLNFKLPLTEGRVLKINNYEFTFNWYYPTNEQFEILESRLKDYLFREKINYYYFSMLMGNKRITDSIPVSVYLKALTETEKDFNFRGEILQYLDEVYNNDSNVIDYFGQCLDSNSFSIQDDLRYLQNISLKLTDKIATYFSRNINNPRNRFYTMNWVQSVNEKVDRSVIHKFTDIIVKQSILTENLDSLSSNEIKNWVSLVKDLKLIGDTALIKYLIPHLQNKSIIKDVPWNIIIRDSNRQIVFPAYRVCDVALETILSIQGMRSSYHYNHIFKDSEGKDINWASSREEHLFHKQAVTEIRDILISGILTQAKIKE
jgi:hypothetical protein